MQSELDALKSGMAGSEETNKVPMKFPSNRSELCGDADDGTPTQPCRVIAVLADGT